VRFAFDRPAPLGLRRRCSDELSGGPFSQRRREANLVYKEKNFWLVLKRTLLAGFKAPIDTFAGNESFFENSPNKLGREILPDAAKWSKAVQVIDPADFCGDNVLKLCANVLDQKFVCYFEPKVK